MIINPYRFAAAGGGFPSDAFAEYLFDTDASDSANAYDGTLTGNASVASGVLSLDGTNDYVEIADAAAFSPTDGAGNDEPFSISLWVKSTVAVSAQQLVARYLNTSEVEYYAQFLGGGNAGKLALTLCSGGSSSIYIYAIGGTAYTQNVWEHLVFTYDGSESETGINLYHDGTDDTSVRGSAGTYAGMSNLAITTTLGTKLSGAGPELTGNLDNVRFYDRELTSAEVTELFNEGHS